MKKKIMAEVLRVLELYSGIGGMHCALKASGAIHKVIAAYDVNTNANKIYQHNFPETPVIDKGIEGITVKAFNDLKIDMILMSPPCQPFTRVGRKQDTQDARTNSFLHVLDLLPRIASLPSYLLVENVKGFETSQAREKLVTTLQQCHYSFQEFLLTPLQFGIPNSRLRYFLIAKKAPLKFGFTSSNEVQSSLPSCASDWLSYRKQAEKETESSSTSEQTKDGPCLCGGYRDKHSAHSDSKQDTIDEKGANSTVKSETETSVLADSSNGDDISKAKRRKIENSGCDVSSSRDSEICGTAVEDTADLSDKSNNRHVCLEDYGSNMRQTHENQPDFGPVLKLKHFLEDNSDGGSDRFSDNVVLDKDLKRFMVMDIVNPCSTKTNCFTKRYGRFMEGAGSIVQGTKDVQAVLQASEFKVQAKKQQNSDSWSEEQMKAVRDMRLRYFTPREIASLMGFPKHFGFPDGLTTRQLYMALGNSLNVHVVAVLIKLMTFNDPALG